MPTSAYFIIAANLLPLVLTLAGVWGLREILPLYWVESAIVGFFAILKILLSGGLLPKDAGDNKAAAAAFSAVVMAGKLFLAGFFTVHFGLFMFVHGVFLFGFILEGAQTGAAQADPTGPLAWLRYLAEVKWGIFALFCGHAASFVLNFILKGEYRNASAKECMARPYPRIIVMHLTILLGAFISFALPGAGAIMAVFVIAKIFADVAAHKKEHAVAAKPPVAEAGPGTAAAL